ncbi:Hsp20/alpha crystallin family protein [candidate division WS5 bacterium]|uniref:Hsp20/alpha crystallin family protein n=1 Tax=candidate division WS5 bacterium TaxID=2093353 RepID=A0A419DGR8_9BACT|nr:MAG: Hsp20/alpha crystallin family protein [candidate division WS5 bacterium]
MKKDSSLTDEGFFASQPLANTWADDEIEGQLAVDVYQTKNAVVVKAPVAGVDPEMIDIDVTNDSVAIRGERYDEKEVDQEGYHFQECYWGSFARSVMLPVECDAERAEATFKNGILTIRLPKIQKTKAKKLKVKPH